MGRLLAAAVVGIAAMLPACDDGGAAEVRAVYDEYNAALNSKDGDRFLRAGDPQNVAHYGQ